MNKHIKIVKLAKLYPNLRDWTIYDKDGIAPTLTSAMGCGGGHVPLIIERISNEQNNIPT